MSLAVLRLYLILIIFMLTFTLNVGYDIAFKGSKYRGAVFACQGIFCIEKQGLEMRLEKEGGVAAVLLRNQITFWSSHPSRGHF